MRAAFVVLAFGVVATAAGDEPDVQIEKVDQFITNLGEGGFSCPTQLAWSNTGTILVADSCQQAVLECALDGDCARLDLQGNFQGVRGIAVDAEDTLYYTTGTANRIGRCAAGEQCGVAFGSSGTGPGQFDGPRELVFDSQGRLVIAERFNQRFQICDLDGSCTVHGRPVDQLPPDPGEFAEAFSLFADGQGLILVGDFGPETVHLCDESGACGSVIGSEGAQPGQFKTPAGLGLTSRGDLVIVELSNNRVSVCSRVGECRVFGAPDFQFAAPTGLLIDAQDRLYISGQDDQRVQVFQLSYADAAPTELNPGFNDAWYNPDTDGQGFYIVVFGDTGAVSLAWFTYDTEQPPDNVDAVVGDPGHRWITALGQFEGLNATLQVYNTTGGRFDNETPAAVPEPYGTIELSFEDCSTGQVVYDMPVPGVTGTVPIQRIVSDNVALCEALAEAPNEAR